MSDLTNSSFFWWLRNKFLFNYWNIELELSKNHKITFCKMVATIRDDNHQECNKIPMTQNETHWCSSLCLKKNVIDSTSECNFNWIKQDFLGIKRAKMTRRSLKQTKNDCWNEEKIWLQSHNNQNKVAINLT